MYLNIMINSWEVCAFIIHSGSFYVDIQGLWKYAYGSYLRDV